MRRPPNNIMNHLKGTFMDYVHKNNLQALIPLLRILSTQRGYATLEEMPLIYGLISVTPRSVLDALAGNIFFLTEDNIQDLFPLMVKDMGIKVMFNFEVIECQKKKTSYDSNVGYRIHGQNKQVEDFDFLIG